MLLRVSSEQYHWFTWAPRGSGLHLCRFRIQCETVFSGLRFFCGLWCRLNSDTIPKGFALEFKHETKHMYLLITDSSECIWSTCDLLLRSFTFGTADTQQSVKFTHLSSQTRLFPFHQLFGFLRSFHTRNEATRHKYVMHSPTKQSGSGGSIVSSTCNTACGWYCLSSGGYKHLFIYFYLVIDVPVSMKNFFSFPLDLLII